MGRPFCRATRPGSRALFPGEGAPSSAPKGPRGSPERKARRKQPGGWIFCRGRYARIQDLAPGTPEDWISRIRTLARRYPDQSPPEPQGDRTRRLGQEDHCPVARFFRRPPAELFNSGGRQISRRSGHPTASLDLRQGRRGRPPVGCLLSSGFRVDANPLPATSRHPGRRLA